jgi:hypothetical protein
MRDGHYPPALAACEPMRQACPCTRPAPGIGQKRNHDATCQRVAGVGGLDGRGRPCPCRRGQARWHAQLRRRRRVLKLRLPQQHHVRPHSSHRTALFAAGEVRRRKLPPGRPRPGPELDGLSRRPELDLQAQGPSEVPRRLASHLRGRQGELPAHHQPAARRGVDPQVLLSRP